MDIKLNYSDLCAIATQVHNKDFVRESAFKASVSVFLYGIRFIVYGYYYDDNSFEASYIVCKPKRYEMDCEYDERTFRSAFVYHNVDVA
ncbi:MAG: hypothetical protein KBT34_10350 [Prevotella sp.]|nr:hypothetical protein [Candidatus Prevotella equi]